MRSNKNAMAGLPCSSLCLQGYLTQLVDRDPVSGYVDTDSSS